MTTQDSSNQESIDAAKKSRREQTAELVPFFIRAWWLRDFEDSADIVWPSTAYVTGAIWSLHSDPLVDAAGLDYPEPF